MFKFLDQIPYLPLLAVALLLGLAPFRPMPHIVEKLIMLKQGQLTRPVDIFDLFLHLAPLLLLLLKLIRSAHSK